MHTIKVQLPLFKCLISRTAFVKLEFYLPFVYYLRSGEVGYMAVALHMRINLKTFGRKIPNDVIKLMDYSNMKSFGILWLNFPLLLFYRNYKELPVIVVSKIKQKK